MSKFIDEQNEKLKTFKEKTIEEIKIHDEAFSSDWISIVFTDCSQINIPTEDSQKEMNIIS